MPQKSNKSLCNFRVQTQRDWENWIWFKNYCNDQGLTICRPLIAFIASFRKFAEGIETAKGERPELINAFPMLVQLKQQNTFVWSVDKPRRTPTDHSLDRFANLSKKRAITIGEYVDSYILDKARFMWMQGQRTFCFKDFIEIQHRKFRNAMSKLKRKKEIVPCTPRTNPRFYFLTDPTLDWND